MSRHDPYTFDQPQATAYGPHGQSAPIVPYNPAGHVVIGGQLYAPVHPSGAPGGLRVSWQRNPWVVAPLALLGLAVGATTVLCIGIALTAVVAWVQANAVQVGLTLLAMVGCTVWVLKHLAPPRRPQMSPMRGTAVRRARPDVDYYDDEPQQYPQPPRRGKVRITNDGWHHSY